MINVDGYMKIMNETFFLISNKNFIQEEKRKQPLQVFKMVNTKNSKQKQLKTEKKKQLKWHY